MRRAALLIPVFNARHALEQTLSMLPSDCQLDVVVVDDGSNPPLELQHGLCANPVEVLRIEKNGGITKALNHGLSWIMERNYEYVARLDAGDFLLEGRIPKQLTFLDKNLEYALIGGNAKFVDWDGNIVFKDLRPTNDLDIRRGMHGRCCFIHTAVMIRVSALRAIGIYDEKYPSAEDFELFFRIMKTYKGANFPDVVVSCIVDPNGISLSRRREQLRTRMLILLKYFDPYLPTSYFGLIKNAIILVAPYSLVRIIKQYWRRRGSGWL